MREIGETEDGRPERRSEYIILSAYYCWRGTKEITAVMNDDDAVNIVYFLVYLEPRNPVRWLQMCSYFCVGRTVVWTRE